MPEVHVLLGSEHDKIHVAESQLMKALRDNDIPVVGRVISPHFNPLELAEYITYNTDKEDVYICGDGGAAALPGAVKAILLSKGGLQAVPVLGVALPSREYPAADDAVTSIKRLPPGIEVEFMGVARLGFNEAAARAIQYVNTFFEPDFEEKCARLAEIIADQPPQDLDFSSYTAA